MGRSVVGSWRVGSRRSGKLESDWHLIAFSVTTQLFSPGDIRALLEVASSPRLLDDLSVLDKVLNSNGWQTLITFTKEMSCK